jgi:hypothetical protein
MRVYLVYWSYDRGRYVSYEGPISDLGTQQSGQLVEAAFVDEQEANTYANRRTVQNNYMEGVRQ